jgi:putative membrane protein
LPVAAHRPEHLHRLADHPGRPFIAYTFLALDVIGEQIEEPFGTEPNDLALASMCHGIEMSVCELVGETPRSTPPEVVDYVVT